MNNILFVSNKTLLNDLYSLNLNAYVDCEIVLKQTCDQAISYIDEKSKIDVIISIDMIANIDSGSIIYQHLIESDLDIPLIVIGDNSDVPDEIGRVSDYCNLSEVIQLVARFINVTAEDMASKAAPMYYGIPLNILYHLDKSPCDIFYRLQRDVENIDYL